ncbi:zinc metallopeptidase RseP [Stieleria maiorica]|uniref:Zinc metallopeptidase RseP n=1 Tax=Stieleria maiorica TaxID=2795974 RepID=A0A5B9MJS1_9BACT|nr:PDZ domain-containing protein [Stieleria maiorica]QEG00690.1 zinc metallopeptidase RseP [Stieleria maiorica]
MNEDQLENPVLGYVVIAVALVVGMLSATVFGQGAEEPLPNRPQACQVRLAGEGKTGDHGTGDGDSATSDQDAANSRTPGANSASISRRESASHEPLSSAARRWILGVRCKPTTAGCVVTSVVPGSAAERVGLIAGDRILTVDGTQVGWHGDRLNPLHQAVDEAPTRRVRLLVQRAESGLIRPLHATLQTMLETLGH